MLTLRYPEPISVGDAGIQHLVLVFGASYLPSIHAEVVRMGFRDLEHFLQVIRK